MIVLGLDPSSTRTGYALMSRVDTIIEAGYLSAPQRPLALDRIAAMRRDLLQLLYSSETRPDLVVIEVTSGKVTRRHRGGGAGLGVYGMAVGALWATCLQELRFDQVVGVFENTWTASRTKSARARGIAAQFPEYAAEMGQDGGGDVADAIGILQWWFLCNWKAKKPASC